MKLFWNGLLLVVLLGICWSAGFRLDILMQMQPVFIFVGIAWLIAMLSTGGLRRTGGGKS